VKTYILNTDLIVNSKFYELIKPVKPEYKKPRTGALAYKVGMTGIWDKWGVRHALTVLHIDRC
jgi:hypothetical protein